MYQTPSTCCCRYRCPWLGQSLDLIWNHGTWLNSTYIVLLRGKGFPGVNSSPNSGKHPLPSPSPAITTWRVLRARFLPPQAKLSSPNANSHFQLTPKHRYGDPKKIIGIHYDDSCLTVWKFKSDRGVPRLFFLTRMEPNGSLSRNIPTYRCWNALWYPSLNDYHSSIVNNHFC